MNQRRYQQNNQQNNSQNGNSGNRSQYQYRAPSRKEQLERDLQYLEKDLVSLDAQIDALGQKGMLLEAAKNTHMQGIPGAIAQVALSTLGVKYLPPVARTWYFKYQQFLRSEEALRQHAVTLHYKREAIATQIEHIEIQIEMLQFAP